MSEPTSFLDTTPSCCKRTTPWFLWQQILVGAIAYSPTPAEPDNLVTESGDQLITEGGDTIILED